MPLDLDNSVSLNRLGIILNFVAGFLIAPELLGSRNLERLEQWLESAEGWVQRGLAMISGGGDVTTSKPYRLARTLVVFTTVFTVAFWWFVWRTESAPRKALPMLLFALLTAQVIWILGPSVRSSTSDEFERRFRLLRWPVLGQSALALIVVVFTWTISSIAFTLLAMIIVYLIVTPSIAKATLSLDPSLLNRATSVVVLVAFFPAQLAYIVVTSLIAALILLGRLTLRILSPSRQSLRESLVTIGIVFFIVGSALQFASTFISSPTCATCISE